MISALLTNTIDATNSTVQQLASVRKTVLRVIEALFVDLPREGIEPIFLDLAGNHVREQQERCAELQPDPLGHTDFNSGMRGAVEWLQ